MALRKILYYVPLIPRPGIRYALTEHDLKLITADLPTLKKTQKDLENYAGKPYIPDSDFPHFVAGMFVRACVAGALTEGFGFFLAFGAGGCNIALDNTNEIRDMQDFLQRSIQEQAGQTK